jgi:hypothetical protein
MARGKMTGLIIRQKNGKNCEESQNAIFGNTMFGCDWQFMLSDDKEDKSN